MRRLLVTFAVLMLCLPAAGMAERRGPNDGTFSLRGGRGTFTVNARGGVIGTLVRGRVIITDPLPDDGTGPIVSLSSDDWRVERNSNTTVYGGTNIRFRLLGGTFRIKVVGRGVNLS